MGNALIWLYNHYKMICLPVAGGVFILSFCFPVTEEQTRKIAEVVTGAILVGFVLYVLVDLVVIRIRNNIQEIIHQDKPLNNDEEAAVLMGFGQIQGLFLLVFVAVVVLASVLFYQVAWPSIYRWKVTSVPVISRFASVDQISRKDTAFFQRRPALYAITGYLIEEAKGDEKVWILSAATPRLLHPSPPIDIKVSLAGANAGGYKTAAYAFRRHHDGNNEFHAELEVHVPNDNTMIIKTNSLETDDDIYLILRLSPKGKTTNLPENYNELFSLEVIKQGEDKK